MIESRKGRMRWPAVLLGCAAFFTIFFSPVIFGGLYLAWGDGLSIGLPAFLAPHAVWEPNIMLGYPWAANLNGYWYPLRLLHVLPNSFNAFVVAAYAIAAFSMFGLVSSLTRSTMAAIVAALAYTLGGFMTAHSGHHDIVQPAAWSPAVMWSLVELKSKVRVRWIAIGSASIAMCALAGQPQVLAYTMLLALAYAVTMSIGGGRDPRFPVVALLTVGFGVALTAIAFVPAAELSQESVRAQMPFTDFLAFSLSPIEIPIRLFFPYFLGGTLTPVYPFSNVYGEDFTEVSVFVGFATAIFAIAAVFTSWQSKEVRFWSLAALAALILATGDGLHLGQIFYHVPILNLFRAQGRHALEFTLCAAVAGGFGVAAVERGGAGVRRVLAAVFVALAAIGATLAGIAVFDGAFAREAALAGGLPSFPTGPLANPALGIPVVASLLVAAAVVLWSLRPVSWVLRALLLAAVVLDLVSFAWFGPWRVVAVSPKQLEAPPYVARLRAELDRTYTRLLSTTGALPPAVVPPNVSLVWGVPAAGGYVQLELVRIASFLEMQPDGSVDSDVYMQDRNQALDLAAVRYIATVAGAPSDSPIATPFDVAQLNQRVGLPVWASGTEMHVGFPKPVGATSIGLVTSMGDGTDIPDGARVAEIVVTGQNGRTVVLPVLAGRDTAEVTYDRPEVRPIVKHRRAPVYSTTGPYFHNYVATFALPGRMAVRSLALRWRYGDPHHGVLDVDKLSLLDATTHLAHPITTQSMLEGDASRWRRVDDTAPDVVFENLSMRPRAWIVHTIVASTPESALAAIRQGTYDTRNVALVEDPPRFENSGAVASDWVKVAQLAATSEELDVQCASQCFVVVSDTYYHGWDASVDGLPTSLYRADYALRGAVVPAGNHRLRLDYRPRALAAGAIVTLLAACAIGALFLPGVRNRLDWPI